MKVKIIWLMGVLFALQLAYPQGSPDYNGGIVINFDEEGKKYFRIITWAQVQAVYNDQVPSEQEKTNFNIRRARMLMYTQINKKFLILTHFGLNNLTGNTMSPTGTGDGASLFFHDVWAQYSLGENHAIGAGLHYFNGISRLNSQSTLNIMPLDNNRQSWATLGLSDQFGRHLGIYLKGNLGKLQYRVSVNDALTNGLDMRNPNDLNGAAAYAGKRLLGSAAAGKVYAGYFDFNFLDQESHFLPYKVGTYLGGKKIFNLGAGFLLHPSGSVRADAGNVLMGQDIAILAVDAFYDAPLGADGSAVSAYATFQSNGYGKDFLFGPYGTGNMTYAHLGYLLPGPMTKNRLQPYVTYALNTYEAVAQDRTILGLGTNVYFSGNNSKITLEYNRQHFGEQKTGTVALQAMIYL